MKQICPRTLARLSLIAIAGVGAPASHAALPTYSTFALQARSGLSGAPGFNLPPDGSLESQTPDIDAAGFVAIRLLKPAGDAIFVGPGDGTGGLVINGPTEYSGTINLDSTRGLLALALLGGGAEVRNLQGTLLLNYPIGGPQSISAVSGVHLGDGSSLLYRSVAGGVQKLVRDDTSGPTRQTTLLLQTNLIFTSIFQPAGANGRIACVTNTIGDGSSVIRVGPTAADLATIASTGLTYTGFVEGIGINSAGTVAFTAHIAADGSFALLVSDGSSTQTYARVGDLGMLDAGFVATPPSINTSGLVAFRARDANGDAIFVADGVNVARVIGDGDSIQTDLGPVLLGFDSPVEGRQAFGGGITLNDANQIVFNAYLANGTMGVFIAQPDPIVPACPADVDDGSGTGTRDGGVDINDLLYFLIQFEQGGSDADLDNGSGTGVPDGAVTIDDLLFMLVHFENGC